MSILAVIQLAKTVYRITKRVSTYATKYNPGARFAEHFPPNYRPYVKDIYRGTEIAFSGGLISDAIEMLNDGISPPALRAPKKEQTRDYMEQPSSRFRNGKGYNTSYQRSRVSKREYCKRSRY